MLSTGRAVEARSSFRRMCLITPGQTMGRKG